MEVPEIAELFFFIFSGAALLASVALFTKQPLIVAYIGLGVALGPHVGNVLTNVDLLKQMSTIGIIFLLFLLGLDMKPRSLLTTLKKSVVVVAASSAVFFAAGYIIAVSFQFANSDALIIGICSMFSSTIIGIKLLPTTALHHRHIGELLVGILLLQDIIAIIVISLMLSSGGDTTPLLAISKVFFWIPVLASLSFAAVRFVLLPIIARYDRIQEFIFLLSVGWCLGLAEIAELMGLSREIGAFFAGVSLASSPISQYLALSLKPLRDFFLVIFFCALGASLNIGLLGAVALPALTLAAVMLALKPTAFRFLIRGQSETNKLAWDLGTRLGQISEFSLMIVFVAIANSLVSAQAATVIQVAAIISFVVSSYLVVFRLPNPMAPNPELRRD